MARSAKAGGKKSAAKTRNSRSVRGRSPKVEAQKGPAAKPVNAVPDPTQTIAELRRELDKARAGLAARDSAYSERIAYQAATNDVLKMMSASPGDPQPVFDLISVRARDLCNAYGVTVYEFDGALLHWRAATGVSEDSAIREAAKKAYPSPPSRRLLPNRAIMDRAIVHVRDHDADTELHRISFTVKSSVVVPMMRGGLPIGALHMGSRERGGFSDAQVDLLKTFSDQAVIAIENARLFNEVQAKTHDLEEALRYQTGSANILNVIASSPTDVQPVLKAIVESACELCGADDAVVHLREEDALRSVAHHGPIPVGMDRRPINRTFASGRAATDKVAIHIHDVLSTEGDELPEAREMSRRAGIRTILCVPLLRETETVGTILLRRTEVAPFSPKQVALLQTFADQAVIAIENARLFNETEEALARQTATSDVLKVIASSPSSLRPVFDAIAERSNELMGGHSTSVFRFIDDMIELTAFTPISPEADAALAAAFPRRVSNTLFEMTRSGSVLQTPDTELDTEWDPDFKELARARGFRSRLLVPLVGDVGTIGFISVTRKQAGQFASEDVSLLKTFADQAVIAIKNVELFEEVQARTRDLQESLEQQTATSEVLAVISRSPNDLQPVMDAIVETAARLCQADYALILRRDETGVYRIVAHSGASRDVFGWMQENPVTAGDGSAIGITAAAKQTVHMPDILADPRFTDLRRQRKTGTRSTLGVPLLQGDEVIGVILLVRTEVRPFSEKQIELVTSFADQAVIAIANVDLFAQVQQRTRELTQSLDDLRAAQDRLVQTEKLASLGQLTAGIAHEIKNPLNFVNNFSQLSAELIDEMSEVFANPALDEAGRRKELDEIRQLLKGNLEKVVQHGKRADSIVKNMLLHSREGSGELRVADINGLVEESLNLAYHGARAEKSGFNITLQREFDAGAGSAELYPQEITRALLNLISNGFYAATKRKVERSDEAFEPILSAATRNLGKAIEIRIRDNGTGIPPEVREKMFNPFFTTKPTGEGTGLGLSMTHDIIVKQHGGRIDVETEPGAYTEFIITLPRDGSSAIGQKPE